MARGTKLLLFFTAGLTYFWFSRAVAVRDCMEMFSIVDCWRSNPHVPNCDDYDVGRDTSLVLCAEQRKIPLLTGCDDGNLTFVAEMIISVYRAREEAICTNPGMRKVFKENTLCWYQAKSCTQAITFASDYKIPLNCGQLYTDVAECKKTQVDRSCLKWVDRLAKAMYKASPCGACSRGALGSLLFIVTLTVTLLSVLIPNG